MNNHGWHAMVRQANGKTKPVPVTMHEVTNGMVTLGAKPAMHKGVAEGGVNHPTPFTCAARHWSDANWTPAWSCACSASTPPCFLDPRYHRDYCRMSRILQGRLPQVGPRTYAGVLRAQVVQEPSKAVHTAHLPPKFSRLVSPPSAVADMEGDTVMAEAGAQASPAQP